MSSLEFRGTDTQIAFVQGEAIKGLRESLEVLQSHSLADAIYTLETGSVPLQNLDGKSMAGGRHQVAAGRELLPQLRL